MNRMHALLLSLAIGLVAVVGVFAAVHTVGLGNRARAATDVQIAQRSAALDRYAASLRNALARQAPALPASQSAGSALPSQNGAVRVVYHRPPPIVIHKHRSGEHEEAEGRELDD